MKDLHYGIATKAWQPIIGCSPLMPCAQRCWARRTMARVAACNPQKETFQVILTPDRKQWSGEVALDVDHLYDPISWRKPAVIATGFHGDIGRLPAHDIARILGVIERCPQHDFQLLTKVPEQLLASIEKLKLRPLANASIGCSVMFQDGAFGATTLRRHMLMLSLKGWRTHVWYEPALGPVNWTGWEWIERLIYGGESGSAPRANLVKWAKDSLAWTRWSSTPEHKIAFVMKQLGAKPLDADGHLVPRKGRKGDDLEAIPAELRVRELPEVARAV